MSMKFELDRKDNWRLDFHIQVPIGWMSDPNGTCQFDGTYHVFHQYSPRWPYRAHGWGHWTTDDFVTWNFLGGAIIPDMEYDKDGSYSGSSVIRDGEMWCYYTGNVLEEGDHDYDYSGRQANEMLVKSADGVSFGEKACVLPTTGYPAYCSNHVRDPKVWEQDGSWWMLLGARTRNDHGCILLYRSDDGLSWEMAGSATNMGPSAFGYMWECPNIVSIDGREYLLVCPQGVSKRAHMFQNIHNSGYFPVDGKVIDLFTKDPELMDAEAPFACVDEYSFVELDYGFDFYAPQAFVDDSGRTILFGWIGLPDVDTEYDVPTREWSHSLTVPRELSVNAAGRLCQRPVDEIDGLRGTERALTHEAAAGSTGTVGSSSYNMYHLESAVAAIFEDGTCDLELRDIEGTGRILLNGDLEILVDETMLELAFTGAAGRYRTVRRMPYGHLSAGRIENMRVLVDTSVVEIFINDGEVTLTTRWFPLKENLAVTSSIPAGSTRAWEMGEFTFKGVA